MSETPATSIEAIQDSGDYVWAKISKSEADLFLEQRCSQALWQFPSMIYWSRKHEITVAIERDKPDVSSEMIEALRRAGFTGEIVVEKSSVPIWLPGLKQPEPQPTLITRARNALAKVFGAKP